MLQALLLVVTTCPTELTMHTEPQTVFDVIPLLNRASASSGKCDLTARSAGVISRPQVMDPGAQSAFHTLYVVKKCLIHSMECEKISYMDCIKHFWPRGTYIADILTFAATPSTTLCNPSISDWEGRAFLIRQSRSILSGSSPRRTI